MEAIEARHDGTTRLSNASSPSEGKSKTLVAILVIPLDNDLGGGPESVFVPLELAISDPNTLSSSRHWFRGWFDVIERYHLFGFYGGIGVRYFGREVGQSGFALKARKELVTEVLGFGLA